jgi:outer membrane protein TolC
VSPRELEIIAPRAAPEKLSLQEAVELAFQHSSSFRRTIQSMLIARSEWRLERQLWDLGLSGGVTWAGQGETSESSGAELRLSYSIPTGASLSLAAELSLLDSEESAQMLSASLRQPLLAGRGVASATYEGLRRARNSYRRALIAFFESRQNLIESVIGAYLAAVDGRRRSEIQAASVERTKQAVKDAELRLEEGQIVEIDLTRAQLSAASSENQAVLAQQGERDALDQLLLLLGLEVGGKPELAAEVPYEPRAINLEEAIAQALGARTDLLLNRLGIDDLRAGLRIARSERLPSLDLTGGVSRSENGAAQDSWNVGLQISVPLGPAGERLKESVRRAEWALLVALREQEDLKQRVLLEVRSRVRATEAAEARVKIASDSVKVAEKNLQIATEMVNEGLVSNRDLVDAQDGVTNSEISLLDSKVSHYLARVGLQRVLGEDLGKALPRAASPPPPATSQGSAESGKPGTS